MRGKLFISALSKYLAGLLLCLLLIFAPAGTLHYPQGWLLLAVLFVPMLILGAVLLVKAPQLLEKRLRAKEERGAQRQAVGKSALMFVGGFLLASLNFRLGWPLLPFGVSLAAAAIFLLGYLLYAEVLRENAWLSRSVEVQQGQQLVSTGLYGIVRHPMYSATLLLFLSLPLILGSLPAFALFLLYLPIIAGRIRDEETLLSAELPGYAEYRQRVRYKLIPYIW